MKRNEPSTVLVAMRGLEWTMDEGTDLQRILAGLVGATGQRADTRVVATDLRRVYEVVVTEGATELIDVGGLKRWLNSCDLVYLHYGFNVEHLAFAVLVRTLRIPLVLNPDGVLTDDFASWSWYRTRGPAARAVKRLWVSVLRRLWVALTALIVCTSIYERRSSHLVADQTLLAPLPVPDTPLTGRIMTSGVTHRGDPDGPIAFFSRLDVRRKGVDRMVRWLEAYADELPRPAVRLFADLDGTTSRSLQRLVEDGLVEVVPGVRGTDVLPYLEDCRGTILLSRWDGYPRVLREAALLGLPILCTDSCGFAETLAVINGGADVDGDDVHAVQRAFVGLQRAPGSALRARGLLDATTLGCWYLRVFHDVIDGRPAQDRSYYDWFAEVPR